MGTERSVEQETGVVAGVFREEETAARAVSRLIDAHFDPPRDLSVIVAYHKEHQDIPVDERFQIDRSAKVGALLGAALGAGGAGLVAAGLVAGPVGLLAAGPALAALQGAYLGGAGGFALGAVAGLGFWKDEAEFRAADLHGVTWVGVHARGDRAEEARGILRDSGARHLMS